jgi:YfiH family protein
MNHFAPIAPLWPDAPDSIAALSTIRTGGVSFEPFDDSMGNGGLNLALHVGDDPAAVIENRARLRTLLPAEPAWLNQVHGTLVVDAASVQGTPQADASFTNRPGVVCAIMTADCMPVLLRDHRGSVVAAAHAGWRGLAGGVLENTLQAMREAGAQDVMAWLGPAIGPKHFEVGEEVRAAYAHLGTAGANAFRPLDGKKGKYVGDLPMLARLVLAAAGVTQISGGTDCTVSQPQRFYSFRRDGVTGRMASLIWIK